MFNTKIFSLVVIGDLKMRQVRITDSDLIGLYRDFRLDSLLLTLELQTHCLDLQSWQFSIVLRLSEKPPLVHHLYSQESRFWT